MFHVEQFLYYYLIFIDMTIKGQLVDIHNRSVFPARIEVLEGRIRSIVRIESAPNHFIMPGLIDFPHSY